MSVQYAVFSLMVRIDDVLRKGILDSEINGFMLFESGFVFSVDI